MFTTIAAVPAPWAAPIAASPGIAAPLIPPPPPAAAAASEDHQPHHRRGADSCALSDVVWCASVPTGSHGPTSNRADPSTDKAKERSACSCLARSCRGKAPNSHAEPSTHESPEFSAARYVRRDSRHDKKGALRLQTSRERAGLLKRSHQNRSLCGPDPHPGRSLSSRTGLTLGERWRCPSNQNHCREDERPSLLLPHMICSPG